MTLRDALSYHHNTISMLFLEHYYYYYGYCYYYYYSLIEKSSETLSVRCRRGRANEEKKKPVLARPFGGLQDRHRPPTIIMLYADYYNAL